MLKVAQYPRNADGTPMDLFVGVLTDATGNGGARYTNQPVGPDSAPIDSHALLLTNKAGDLIDLEHSIRLTPTSAPFNAVHYDPANPVSAVAGLNAFFEHMRNPNYARVFTYDWAGDWYADGQIDAAVWDGHEPYVDRRIINGSLYVAPLAQLPGGVALDTVMEIAGFRQDWQGPIGLHEHDPTATNQYSNTTYNTRRYKRGIHVRAFASSKLGMVYADGVKRDALWAEGWEAGFTVNGKVFPTANSIGAKFDGCVARLCGSGQHWNATQGPAPLTITALDHGRTAGGVPFSNTEAFTSGTGGFENADAQRSKITVGAGTTTADLEINDFILGRVELKPAFYGTVQVVADGDPTTGTVILTAGDPTNIDGLGNGLKVGELWPIFQAGPNVGKRWRITAFGGVSNRSVSVVRDDIYDVNSGNLVSHAATADPTYQQFGLWVPHWVTRVIDANNVAVTPWYSSKFNGQAQIYHGAAAKFEGDDLANVTVGTIIGNICGKAYHVRSNFAPTVATVLGQVCGVTLQLGDPSYSGGLGNVIKHGHSEFSLFDMISGQHQCTGTINMSSLFNIDNTVAYSPRATVNDQDPVFPRPLGDLTITVSGGTVYEGAVFGGTQDNPSGQFFVSNDKLYRSLTINTDAAYPVEVRYDAAKANRLKKHNWAEIHVAAALGGGGNSTLTLSKKLQALGWSFGGVGTGNSYVIAQELNGVMLRLFYQASNKKVVIYRFGNMFDNTLNVRVPKSLYIGEYTPGAGYVDGNEFVLRNSSGYGLRAAMNGATGQLYMDNQKPGVGFSEFNIRGLPVNIYGDGAVLTAAVSATGVAVTGVVTATGKITGTLGVQSGNDTFYRSDGQLLMRCLTSVDNITNFFAVGSGGYRFWNTGISAITTELFNDGSLTAAGALRSSGGVVGYATGAGGTQVQATNKATAFTLNKACGQFTTNNANLAATTRVTFQVNDSNVLATDNILLNLQSGQATEGTYRYWIEKVGAGFFKVTLENLSAGGLAEALVFNYGIYRTVNA